MKTWISLIELIVVMAVLTIIMAVGSLRISNNNTDKATQAEAISVYNTLNTHNKNISKWKSWAKTWEIIWDNKASSWLNIPTISWNIKSNKIEFQVCSWKIILWKNIILTWDCKSTPYITLCKTEKKNDVHECTGNNTIAQIKFTEISNNISLIWTWEFSNYN